MKREIITIDESGRISVPTVNPEQIWMSEAELIESFHVIAPTFRAAVRAVYRKGLLFPVDAEQRVRMSEDCWQVFYNLEMTIALAFQFQTNPASQLRKYLMEQLVRPKSARPLICVLGRHTTRIGS